MPALIYRTMQPQPRYAFLTHQFGVIETRRAMHPMGSSLFPDGYNVDIFHLLGYGATKEAAEKMAKRNWIDETLPVAECAKCNKRPPYCRCGDR